MMKLFHCLGLVAIPIALTLSAAGYAALPSNAEAEALLKARLIDTGLAKGAAVALVDRNGIRVVAVGFSRDGIPLRADDLFEIGSVTKTFTGTLLALAIEKGEVAEDDPVEKYLPDGLLLRDSSNSPIRLVDLATHRSGLPRLAGNFRPKDSRNPYADYTESDLKAWIKSFRADRERNSQYAYSNIGYGLLGYTLVRAAKSSDYTALLNERILKTLGMNDTSADPTQRRGRLTQPHDPSGRPVPAWDLPLAHAGAGAIRSTAGDMGLYAEALAGLKVTPLASAFALATKVREQGLSVKDPIGLAFNWVPLAERSLINHDGATAGSSSSLVVDADSKEGVFIAANTQAKLTDLAIHLIDKRMPLSSIDFPKQVAVPEKTLMQYAGRYKLTEKMNVTVRVSNGKILAQATGQGEFELFPESDTKFFAKVTPLTITFGDISGGKAGSFEIVQGDTRKAVRVDDFPIEVALPVTTLAQYAGTYRLTDAMNLKVSVKDGKLRAQATGQDDFELFAESETKFFAKVVQLTIKFGDIKNGRAGSLELDQGGKLKAPRVD
jgi:CubicO group peptidase (beta-lactamase class C family)